MNEKHAGVVLKTVERCNIDCTYCYMFNLGDESYKKHPPYISLNTIHNVCAFLKKGCKDLGLDFLTIEFHGGEPLMQKKADFNTMCALFQEELNSVVKLDFCLQTNAMLIDSEWIDLFSKYRVGVGISIDGTKVSHDKNRIDHYKRGTYDRVVEKLRMIQLSKNVKKMGYVGVLCVIDPDYSAKEVYRHMVDNLGIFWVDFLLPYFTHESQLPHPPEIYGRYLCDLLDEWVKDDNPNIHVRVLNSTLGIFMGRASHVYGIGPQNQDDIPLISISTQGDLSPTDELRATANPDVNCEGCNVKNKTFSEFLDMPIFHKISLSQKILPETCQLCCWQNVCGGGGIVNRYSIRNYFNNPSVYCEGLKSFYTEVAAFMLNHGYDYNKMVLALKEKSEKFQ